MRLILSVCNWIVCLVIMLGEVLYSKWLLMSIGSLVFDCVMRSSLLGWMVVIVAVTVFIFLGLWL